MHTAQLAQYGKPTSIAAGHYYYLHANYAHYAAFKYWTTYVVLKVMPKYYYLSYEKSASVLEHNISVLYCKLQRLQSEKVSHISIFTIKELGT